MDIQRGFRDKIEKNISIDKTIQIDMNVFGSAIYDYCCFGVDDCNKLSDDRYMVFYNQVQSPNGEIVYTENENGVTFAVNLAKLPENIKKIIFTISVDGNGNMGEIISHNVTIKQGLQQVYNMKLSGKDFHNEKAIISIEMYKKDVWRFAVIARGFDGGLKELLRYYGGKESEEQNTVNSSNIMQPMPEIMKVSLKKGQKVSLSKNSEHPIIVENGWAAKGKDYDLKALVRYRNGRLIYIGAANSDELLVTPEGAVRHGGDIKHPGELEHIYISWHPDIASVAVSSYSALENGIGSFYEYGVFVRIKNGTQIIEIPASNTSANRKSYTLCFGEIIFGEEKNIFEVSALEMYSRPGSEYRIGYKNGEVKMDIGPMGKTKN